MSKDRISAALEKHCWFLAYVRVNALLHDCDKSFADFLLWSLVENLPKEIKANRSSPRYYDKHHASKEPGEASLKREEYLQYWQNAVAKTTEDITDDTAIHFSTSSCYASYLDGKDKKEYQITQKQTVLCHSIYDFFTYHHDWPNCIEQAEGSTALFLFISGVGGIDGEDTGYETETEKHRQDQFNNRQEKDNKNKNQKPLNYNGHHSPDTTNNDIVLISTPFGFEQRVDIKSAEQELAVIRKQLEGVITALQNGNQPMEAVAELEVEIEKPFRKTIIAYRKAGKRCHPCRSFHFNRCLNRCSSRKGSS